MDVNIYAGLVLGVFLLADKKLKVQQVKTVALDAVHLFVLYACDDGKVAVAVVNIVAKLRTDKDHS